MVTKGVSWDDNNNVLIYFPDGSSVGVTILGKELERFRDFLNTSGSTKSLNIGNSLWVNKRNITKVIFRE